mgnify:CR=1 FL=1|tara:strand:- start:164 stop:1201 length:1038 start_codon:yes stop_codon:yes gene_type:complete
MAVNVSMQTPISSYGNFGSEVGKAMTSMADRHSEEKKLQWKIESQEIMQLRDLNEKAREFDLDLELRRDIFDVDAENTLRRLDADMDQYWEYTEDMNALNLDNAIYHTNNSRQIDAEQQQLQSEFGVNYDKFKAEIANAQKVYEKDRDETANHPTKSWYNLVQHVQDVKHDIGLPGWGISSSEIIDRNLKNVDEKYKQTLQGIYDKYGITAPVEISFDASNPDAAHIMNPPTLNDMMSSEKFVGTNLSSKWESGNLHSTTLAGLRAFDQTNIMNPTVSSTSLYQLIDDNAPTRADITNLHNQALPMYFQPYGPYQPPQGLMGNTYANPAGYESTIQDPYNNYNNK